IRQSSPENLATGAGTRAAGPGPPVGTPRSGPRTPRPVDRHYSGRPRGMVLGRAGVNYDRASHELAAAAKALGVPLLPITVADVNDLPTRIAEMTKHQCRALVAMSEPLFVQESRQLIELAGQYRIAASYDNRLIVDAGGLMSYGPDTVDMLRQAARYVDKILKGEKPADLPIEQPTKFVLA